MDMRPNFKLSPNVKIMINIGATMDIPTGDYITGQYGESILNGGLGSLTGVVGIGNNFKSTTLNYMMLSAASKVEESTPTSINSYDTENNMHEAHLRKFASRFEVFNKKDIFNGGTWQITDKTVYYANEWYEVLKTFLNDKKKNADKISLTTPFLDRDGKLMKIITPTFGAVDSFSEFETSDVADIQNKNELGDSGGNTIHMRQGLAKTRFLMDIPTLAGSSYHYTLLSAHIGKEMQMASGPYAPPPPKKLQHLKHNDKLKGVTDKFTFLMSNCWQASNAAPYINQATKGPEYPRNPDDNVTGDMDLNLVTLRQLRSKSGQSGIVLEILVSQSEGVLPELTEFHYIKSSDRFGISGTMQHYNLDIYPECKISRTTIRSKIATDAKLRRALNITSELAQMQHLWRHLGAEIFCTPSQLYEDLKKKGYDWDLLLNTRGYWLFDNDKHPIPFLSTMDLLRMRLDQEVPGFKPYHPYWYPVKKEDLVKK
jgi:hypothetical protein